MHTQRAVTTVRVVILSERGLREKQHAECQPVAAVVIGFCVAEKAICSCCDCSVQDGEGVRDHMDIVAGHTDLEYIVAREFE